MIDNIEEVPCTRCLHQEVCRHKQDFLDICNAVSSIKIHKPCEDGKEVKMTPITNFDCLGDIYVECRYYQMQAINPKLFDTVTNQYITVTNPSTLSNTPNPYLISATNKED